MAGIEDISEEKTGRQPEKKLKADVIKLADQYGCLLRRKQFKVTFNI